MTRKTEQQREFIPAGVGALRARISRERMIRLLQTGAVAGEVIDGKYLVDRLSLEQWIANHQSEPVSAA